MVENECFRRRTTNRVRSSCWLLIDFRVGVMVWLQGEQALQETADFYNTVPIIVPRVAHDLMLDVDWELAAAAISKVVAAVTALPARV